MMCSYEGCDRPRRAKGLCSAHLRQQNRGGPLKPLRSRSAAGVQSCRVKGCDTPVPTRGMTCAEHRDARREDPARLCTFVGCRRVLHGRGLCRPHYTQWHRGEKLRPLQARAPQGRRSCAVAGCTTLVSRKGERCAEHEPTPAPTPAAATEPWVPGSTVGKDRSHLRMVGGKTTELPPLYACAIPDEIKSAARRALEAHDAMDLAEMLGVA